jgi:hypothetical protein
MLLRLCDRGTIALDDADLEHLNDSSFRRDLCGLASDHRVLGLALVALGKTPRLAELAPETRDALFEPLTALRERTERQDRELARLLGRLRAEGLEPVVLKGPALRRTVYSESVERRFGDFDLLFPSEHVDAAIRVATEAGYAFPFSANKRSGYRDLHFHELLRHPERFSAEFHWGLTKPNGPFHLDPELFLEESLRIEGTGGTPLRVPPAELMLLHLSWQGIRHSFSRLVYMVDFDRLLASSPELDWDRVVALARQGGLESLVVLSLALTRELLGTAIPATPLQQLAPARLGRTHLELMRPAASLLEQRLLQGSASSALLLWLATGWRRRCALLLRRASGREHAEQWIYQPLEEHPPGALEALWRGLKSTVKLAAYHLWLYARGLGEAFWRRFSGAGSLPSSASRP